MTENAALPWYRKLHWQVLIAMGVGVIAGLTGGETAASWVGWLGTLFMRLLRMIIVPLILTSIVSGVASIGGGRALGRMFSKTLAYYALSSMLAILTGLFIVNLIRPGAGADFGTMEGAEIPELETPSSPIQLLLDIVPENFFAAASEADMLAVIFFSIVLGMTIGSLPSKPQSVLTTLFSAAFEAMMKLTGGVIRFLPLGVFGLMTSAIAQFGLESFAPLFKYWITIATGLSIHLLITLPILLVLLGRINPRIHFRNMLDPLLVAFSSSSSGATLPVTLDTVQNKVGVSNRVASFVLPMGATVNMDGTALYECAGVLFIAQALGIDLTMGQQAIVVLTALLASIGAAAVPSAGLVIIFIVLESVGLRGPNIELIVGFMLAIDRPLDMARTMVNVFSDSCGAAIIARSEGETNVDVPSVAAG
jgi:Na+/H+-dicarboxylate symporter